MIKHGKKLENVAIAVKAEKTVDPTASLKATIADLQQSIQDERAHNRALQAYMSDAEELKKALATGLRAERADLLARVERIDSRLVALGSSVVRPGQEQHVAQSYWHNLTQQSKP